MEHLISCPFSFCAVTLLWMGRSHVFMYQYLYYNIYLSGCPGFVVLRSVCAP
jgi:hypothetical protein